MKTRAIRIPNPPPATTACKCKTLYITVNKILQNPSKNCLNLKYHCFKIYEKEKRPGRPEAIKIQTGWRRGLRSDGLGAIWGIRQPDKCEIWAKPAEWKGERTANMSWLIERRESRWNTGTAKTFELKIGRDTGGKKGTQQENTASAHVLHGFSRVQRTGWRRSLISQVQFSITELQEEDSRRD